MINPALHIDDIPVINLADGLAKDPAALADTVRHICHDVGLFVVTNHGVAKDVVDDAFRVGKALFSLPREQKLLIDKRLSPHFRGWEAEGAEYTNNQPDIREQVDLWSEHPARNPQVEPAYLRLLGPNQWMPEDVLAEHQKVMTRWFDEAGKLADELMSLLSVGLGLPAGYFEALFGEERMSLTKLIRYPATPEGMFGVNAHHDAGFLTVLAAGETPGLEIQNAADEWVPVPVIPDSFVINLGEMLQAITGNYYVATTHRVFTASERFSLGYFHGPSLDTKLSQIDLAPEFTEAVKSSPRHSSAGFMASTDDTNSGVSDMAGDQKASTYGEQLWNYFHRSYPENMALHYPPAE